MCKHLLTHEKYSQIMFLHTHTHTPNAHDLFQLRHYLFQYQNYITEFFRLLGYYAV